MTAPRGLRTLQDDTWPRDRALALLDVSARAHSRAQQKCRIHSIWRCARARRRNSIAGEAFSAWYRRSAPRPQQQGSIAAQRGCKWRHRNVPPGTPIATLPPRCVRVFAGTDAPSGFGAARRAPFAARCVPRAVHAPFAALPESPQRQRQSARFCWHSAPNTPTLVATAATARRKQGYCASRHGDGDAGAAAEAAALI